MISARTNSGQRFARPLTELGASVREAFPRWTVMHDPEGNQFCVYRLDENYSIEGGAHDRVHLD
ncbi:MAG TPA: VOC family protein [Chloroflexota bacterium]|nr:VOC family protein [Chloroflexota bacterium]